MDATDLAALRGGLLAFCYQMLGSPFDAEDAVQDALERAWRSRDAYDPARAALSTWVYRIARNVCVDRIRESPRRPLPRDLSDPGIDVGAPLVPALDVPWLVPAPTSWWDDSEPERAVAEASGVRLAVTLVLQALPPRQRGVFILREVLGHSAAETAQILETSVPSVNSALQRAKAAVAERSTRPAPLRRDTVERYARAIERADVAALAALVADDVLFEMPPVPRWSIGRETYAAFMAHLFSWQGSRWLTRPISANGQHGILLLIVTDEGPRPHTVQLFEADATGTRIGHVLVYRDEALFALFERAGVVAG
ncbi:RNA polymerase subunit sigma-70 [Microbacterium azadirachtae]|uniref:RNA polymerase subunit sigma-70 n=1 Tax=Microbacterium azadirachtae TaxID=582680 RepID=UPI0021D49035|nr:RNA polymerase subunit sigma-70 [Microbacterium azadirachtae]UXW84955.1 RNA polymerase subunit sigma-70 [Microbacterium azadirachtae]